MLERLSADARRALVAAHEAARAAGAERIGLCHLVYGLLTAAGGEQSERLGSIGLTADAVAEHMAPASSDDSGPPPLTPAEARELRSQLRERGMTAEEAKAIVAEVQQQRAFGPVSLDDGARDAVTRALSSAEDEVDVHRLLVAVLDEPRPELASLLVTVGVAPADIAQALA